MRISSNSFTMDLSQRYQKNQSSGAQPTSFDDLLNAAKSDVQSAAVSGSVQEGHFVNPNMQIISDYEQWKSQQPERVLPDSQGATEENLAYLLENFSGELSLFQRMEAVDTMREMGIITYKQMYEAFGLDFTLVEMPKNGIVVTELESGRNMDSAVPAHPLMDARYLDEIFELLDRLLRGDTEEDLANDLQEAFDRVKQGIQIIQGFQG